MSYCILVSGQQGSGKTYFAMNIFNKYKGKKLFIAPDLNDNTTASIPVLSKNSNQGKIAYEKKYDNALINFSNGLLVFDDARFYFHQNRNETFRKILIRRRQFNRDIIFIAHSLNEIPPSYFYFCTHIVLFKGSISGKHIDRLPFSDEKKTEIMRTQNEITNIKTYKIIKI